MDVKSFNHKLSPVMSCGLGTPPSRGRFGMASPGSHAVSSLVFCAEGNHVFALSAAQGLGDDRAVRCGVAAKLRNIHDMRTTQRKSAEKSRARSGFHLSLSGNNT
jgi:hypothetical protein